ncbi:hypothetical protein AB834_00590 [PVC group bacterium (ex Bugula neritina AB1)]|nr:hypothetical protein AB834_00590 [PVC group bacterium (ex Bugula neritina AB1)]
MHIKNCDGIFKCDKCSIFFKYKQSFNRHLNNHTDKTYFPCEYCDGFFNRKDALASHLRSIHSNNINSSTNTIEEILLRTEKTEKSFICETCEHDCLTKQELKNHARTHSPTYSKCNFCLRGFKSKKGLINHQRSKHPETAPPLKRPLKKTSRRQNPKGPSYLYTSQFT